LYWLAYSRRFPISSFPIPVSQLVGKSACALGEGLHESSGQSARMAGGPRARIATSGNASSVTGFPCHAVLDIVYVLVWSTFLTFVGLSFNLLPNTRLCWPAVQSSRRTCMETWLPARLVRVISLRSVLITKGYCMYHVLCINIMIGLFDTVPSTEVLNWLFAGTCPRSNCLYNVQPQGGNWKWRAGISHGRNRTPPTTCIQAI
jgi:hypothetical protein